MRTDAFRLAAPSVAQKRVASVGDDLMTAAYYPLTPKAMRAIEAIEYYWNGASIRVFTVVGKFEVKNSVDQVTFIAAS